MRAISWLIVPAILALPLSAMAQTGASTSGQTAVASFKSLDRNGDGGLSRAELWARGRDKAAQALFALLDSDGDGRLSLKEFTGVSSIPLLGRFDAYDVNKDGYVTKGEFPNFVDPLLFAALDRNHDARISLGEIRPAFAGSRGMVVQANDQPVKRKAARQQPPVQSWCWVTGFAAHGWTVEAPVGSGGCSTSPPH